LEIDRKCKSPLSSKWKSPSLRYRAAIAHDTEVKAVLRTYRKALDALQRLDRARRDFRSALLTAHEAGATKAELARALGVSRQRVDEVLGRARHERAAGVEDVTD
jgi:DNA-directed RNA polymerase specialized sigma24 family protein